MMKVAKYRERVKRTAPKDLHFHQLYYCYLLATKTCLTLLQQHGLQPARFLCLWDFPGKNTGMGCRLLLQRIFTPQGSNLCLSCLLYWQFFTTLPMSHLGSPFGGSSSNNPHCYPVSFLLLVPFNLRCPTSPTFAFPAESLFISNQPFLQCHLLHKDFPDALPAGYISPLTSCSSNQYLLAVN